MTLHFNSDFFFWFVMAGCCLVYNATNLVVLDPRLEHSHFSTLCQHYFKALLLIQRQILWLHGEGGILYNVKLEGITGPVFVTSAEICGVESSQTPTEDAVDAVLASALLVSICSCF